MTPTAKRLLRSSAPMVALLATMVMVGYSVLRPNGQPVRAEGSARSLIFGSIILVAITAGLYAIRRTQRPGGNLAREGRASAIWRRTTRVVPVASSLSVLLAAVVVDLPVHPGFGSVDRFLVRGLLWCGLGVNLLLALRRPVRFPQLLPIAVVPLTLLGAAWGVAALTSSFLPAAAFLTAPLALAGTAGLIVVPTVLIAAAVSGLEDTHRRTKWLTDLIERRPRTVLLVLAANIVLIGLVWALGHWSHPDWVFWGSGATAWVASGLCAVLLVSALTLDRRLGLTAADHAQIARVAAVLVAVPLAILMLVAIGLVFVSLSLGRPLTLSCLVCLVVAALLANRFLGRHHRARCLGIVVLALGLSPVSAVSTGASSLAAGLGGVTQGAVQYRPLVTLLVTVLGSTILAVVLVAIITRRTRLLVYLLAVGLWVLLTVALNLWVGGAPVLSLETVLTVLLAAATILWLGRRQVEIDGFEVVLTAAVTTSLWLVPLALRLVPEPLGGWLVAAAILAPGATAAWTRLRELHAPAATPTPTHEGKLGVVCLSYALLATLVWTIGGSPASFPDALATALLTYLLPPLALLLILAASAGRARVTPGRPPVRQKSAA